MNAGRWAAGIVGTLIVIGYAAGSGIWVSTGDAWYRNLNRPPWQPPDVVFGLIWPYNFTVLIIAGIAVAVSGSIAQRWTWLAALALSVVAALTWARLFYVEHALWGAAIALCAAAVITIPALITAWRVHTWAGVILLPYLTWVGIASTLAIGYAARN